MKQLLESVDREFKAEKLVRSCGVEPDLQPSYLMLRPRIPSKLEGTGIYVPSPEFDNQPEVVAVLGGGVQHLDCLVVELQTQDPRNAA